jgi:hypothetical protein
MPVFRVRLSLAALAIAMLAFAGQGASSRGEEKEEMPEDGRFRTADGLRLYYQWYAGGKGEKSDCVILVPNYGSDLTKGPWISLAKGLRKEGYSVLLFDFRGHGKNTDFRTMSKPDEFCNHPYNRYSGQVLNKTTIKELKKERFSPAYYPYLVNDLTGARKFLDEQNDARQCNSGRVFVIAEQSISPLVMLWASTEFARYGFGPKNRMDEPEKVSAGEDLCGIVFLSWQGSTGTGTGTAISVAQKVMADKELGSETVRIGDQLRKKVAMAFIYGKEDGQSRLEARNWFGRFGIPPTKNSEPELVKYIREVPGAEKLSGINLYNIMEKQKDSDDKFSYLESQIVEFMKATKTKAINGNNWKQRNMENLDSVPVPLDAWGLKAPK